MITLILRWTTLALWLLWLLVYLEAGRWLIFTDHPVKVANSHVDALALGTVVVLTFLVLRTGLLMTLQPDAPTPATEAWPAVLGALLTLLGMAGTFYCRRYLGPFWATQTVLRAGHRVIDQGPYRLVRHPTYAAALLMYAGTALVFPSLWNGVACTLLIATHVFRAGYEDRFLAANLPGYPEYQRRVRQRLIPGIW